MIRKLTTPYYPFKNTQEAVAYGRLVKDRPKVLKALKRERKALLKQCRAIMGQAKVTDAELQEGLNLAVKAQLVREALESAAGKFREVKIEMLKKKIKGV